MKLIYALALGTVLGTITYAQSSSPVATPNPSKDQAASAKAAATAAIAATPSTTVPFDLSKGFGSIAEKVIPGVVNVSTTQIIESRRGKGRGAEGGGGDDRFPQMFPGSPFDDFFKEFFDQQERPRKVQSLGSGFIIKADDKTAIIVTNYHVIADSKKVSIFLHDNTELEAKVLSSDERTDIALLEVKTDSLPGDKKKLVALEWADSSQSKVGDWVLAVGNPFGLGSTVTAGIISNKARDIAFRGGGSSRVSEYVDDFIQHTAPINMGNSGGPVFNLEGKVIGINTAIFSPSGGNVGIGFAVPSNVAQDTVKQLLESGRTRRGWLGVRVQKVTADMAPALGLSKAQGEIVGSVTPDGPAAKAGIKAGDVIIEFNGKALIDSESRISRMVGSTPVGSSVPVKVWRDRKEVILNVTLGEFETAEKAANDGALASADKDGAIQSTILGLTLAPLPANKKEQIRSADNPQGTGVLVTAVDPGSNASEIGIRRGDVIVKVVSTDVNAPDDVIKKIKEAKANGEKSILLLLNRENSPVFVPLATSDDAAATADAMKKADGNPAPAAPAAPAPAAPTIASKPDAAAEADNSAKK